MSGLGGRYSPLPVHPNGMDVCFMALGSHERGNVVVHRVNPPKKYIQRPKRCKNLRLMSVMIAAALNDKFPDSKQFTRKKIFTKISSEVTPKVTLEQCNRGLLAFSQKMRSKKEDVTPEDAILAFRHNIYHARN